MYLASAAAKNDQFLPRCRCKRELKGNKTGQTHNKQLLQFFPQSLVLGVCLCRTFCLGSCVTAQRILMGQPSFKGSTSFRRSAGRNLSLRKRKGLYMSLHVLTHGLAVHETSLCEATNPRLSMLPKGYSVCIPLRFSALTEWDTKSLPKSLQPAVSGRSRHEATAYRVSQPGLEACQYLRGSKTCAFP